MNRVKSMIPKSGRRFSEKIMLKQPAKAKYHLKSFRFSCIAALAGAVIAASACVVAIAQDAPHGDNRQTDLFGGRLFHLPRPFRTRRRLERPGADPCQHGDAV